MGDDGWGSSNGGGWGDSGGFDSADAGGDSGTTERKRGCFICGEEGHRKSDCPQAGENGGGDDTCFKCGESGHRKADCPSGGGGGDKCYNCGKEGHRSSDCDKPVTCRKCGEEGHKSSECETGFVTRTYENEEGKKVEIYVPTELDDNSLFAETGISSGINFDKISKIDVTCEGSKTIKAIATFEEANLRKLLTDNVARSNYTKPTPVQRHAIPIVLAGEDMMACAQTGSGKTAAFLLPILHNILEGGDTASPGDSPQKPQALVVAPTRELASQIKDEARKFAHGSMVKAVVAYGGTSSGHQLMQLFKGTDVLIATPGRLMDFVDKGKISFENLKYLVLDEADRMLDMGFLPEMQRIVSSGSMPPKDERTTLMFSATFPEQVRELAKEFLKDDYLFVKVGLVGGVNTDVQQNFIQVDQFAKRDKLKEILDEVGSERTLVFVETKRNADFIASFLCECGYPTTSIHGDRYQSERDQALRDFKSGNKPILVATAVAARGLDIKGVAHVVNYDLPKSIDEYVHRIGRTGRVGNTGKATSFYDSGNNKELVSELLRILKEAQVEVPDWLEGEGGEGGGSNGAAGGGGDEEEEW